MESTVSALKEVWPLISWAPGVLATAFVWLTQRAIRNELSAFATKADLSPLADRVSAVEADLRVINERIAAMPTAALNATMAQVLAQLESMDKSIQRLDREISRTTDWMIDHGK